MYNYKKMVLMLSFLFLVSSFSWIQSFNLRYPWWYFFDKDKKMIADIESRYTAHRKKFFRLLGSCKKKYQDKIDIKAGIICYALIKYGPVIRDLSIQIEKETVKNLQQLEEKKLCDQADGLCDNLRNFIKIVQEAKELTDHPTLESIKSSSLMQI